MKLINKLILIIVLFSGAAFAENNPELDNLKKLADMIGVDFNSLRFQDDSKNEITVKEFNVFVSNQRSFNIVEISGVKTLVINPIESNESTAKNKQEDKNVVVATKTFPDFNLFSTKGNKLTLADFKGKPTLLSFYYSTCIPCIHEVPVLNKLKKNLNQQMNFIAVTYEDLETALGFSTKYDFKWDSIIAAETLIEQINIPGYPAFILLDKNGIPISSRVGNATHNTIEALTSWIEVSGVSL